jgi:two-component system, chemotaxis family, chemotaxis protein CheY
MNTTILVVEDSDDLRELVCTTLRRAGYAVLEADNGAAALALIEQLPEPPCLVLLDLMMPIMSGEQLLAKLEESGKLATLPVVVTSAVADHHRPSGARAYVRKPVSETLLLQLVGEFC